MTHRSGSLRWGLVITDDAVAHGGLGQVIGQSEALAYEVGITLERFGVTGNL